MALTGVKWTYEDLLYMPPDGKRHEIIDGAHLVTPSPSAKHQRIVGNLYLLLGNYLRKHPIGTLWLAPFDVILSDINVVEPDLLYVKKTARETIQEAGVFGPPALAIEVLSPSSRKTDEITKRKLYESYGVEEYWIVDPELETVKIHRQAENKFAPPIVFDETNPTFTSPLFPDLAIAIPEVFADIA